MYCDRCGNRLMGYEKYCPNCGNTIKDNVKDIDIANDNMNKSTEGNRSASIVLGGLSLGGVFLGIFAPISLILSIIGLVLAIKSNKNSKNTVGIVLNAIGLFLSFIITGFIILVINFVVNTSNGVIDEYWDNYYNTYERQDF